MMAQIKTLEDQAAEPGFWDDMEQSGKVLQKTKQLKEKLARYQGLQQTCEDLQVHIELCLEMGDDGDADEIEAAYGTLEKDFETISLETLLSGV